MNKKLRRVNPTKKDCNCCNKDQCPLQGMCQTECVVYRAEVNDTRTGEMKDYIGVTAPPFKLRYANHQTTFRHERYEHSTELTKYIWALKWQGSHPSVSWSIFAKAPEYNAESKKCHLCLTEKMKIITWPKENRLNKHPELVSTCRHASKHLNNYLSQIT